MSYNGSGTFSINSAGQPVITGTVISSTAFNALTADLATGLSTAITKDGQTTTTARILFAQGVSSTLVTDATSATTGSIITAGGISMQKALWVGTTATIAGATTMAGITATSLALGGATLGTNALAVTGTMSLSGLLTAAGGVSSTLTTDATSATTGSIITAGGISCQKAAVVGTLLGVGIASSTWSTGNAAEFGSTGNAVWGAAGGGSGAPMFILQNSYYNGAYKYAATAPASYYQQNNGVHGWYTAPSGTAAATATFTNVMSLTQAGLLGIGMTPSNVLDITQSQNAVSYISLLNANAGASAGTRFVMGNSAGAGRAQLMQFGGGYTTSGIFRQDGTMLQANGAGGLTLVSDTQPMYFAIGATEVARFSTSGKFVVGGTNTSYGVISGYGSDGTIFGFDAKTTLNVSTSATTIGTNNDVGFYMVIGASTTPTHRFTDIVLGGYQTATVIGTQNTFGSPSARTYSVTGASFQLAMASGTYDISVFKISMPQIY